MPRLRAVSDGPLDGFHPALGEWFARRFPAGPTEAQALGWPSIAAGSDTLIAAPTGSGKTLAAFLVAIDACLRHSLEGGERRTSVLYVSPLRALTVDVQQNLVAPLAEIAEIAAELGLAAPDVRVAVRNGDTPSAQRQAMLRDRPDIVVTTPESLYLLATAARGRELLGTVDTVIVDEIHAIARDKRGAHLALTLERVDRIVAAAGGRRPTRIGLSATQRPIATVARLLVGAGEGRSEADGTPRCAIVDVGHRRALDIEIRLPPDELAAVMSTDQLDETVALLGELIEAHRTTLVFVNTRRMAERVAHLLAERLGEEAVSAHHGSLSMERRLSVERRLRDGELRAVVATASLELGIDVGPVDLVCQLGSPRAIATFLQRVGRADHRRDGTPKGRIFPFTRDELVECVALFGAVHSGDLDAVHPPVAPLDILAQQIVAECAAAGSEGITEAEVATLVRSAAPYAALSDGDLAAVVELVTEGVVTGRGRRGAHVQHDRVNKVLRGRRGARLVAATSGGAIPELADYRVVLEPESSLVGTVHEDFAIEAMAGDVFLLGSTSWRVLRVEQGTVRVMDADGAAPTLPFWLGEAPSRTEELADAISRLRSLVMAEIALGGPPAAVAALEGWAQCGRRPAEEVVAYLACGLTELGTLPTKGELVLERFFDDTGGMQLVLHSPYGGRVNRGLGLALRKRFCRSFDFELQAAANDDAVVLSLGPQHSFPLEEVGRYLSPETVREVLIQAVLPTPIFTSRWRWNLSRSLVSPRFRGARHLPPAIQRMEADDLMAAVFPALAACQENATGPIEIPDHPLVRQTLDDCCTEAMDLAALTTLVTRLRSGEVALHCVDTTEASVLSHEIVNGRPYTFLDDAPLEERRTRAVALRRGIPLEAHDLSSLDPAIVDEVAAEIAPDPRDPDELHDLLMACALVLPEDGWLELHGALATAGRAMTVTTGEGASPRWCATERRELLEAAFPEAAFTPDLRLEGAAPVGREEALVALVAGALELAPPRRVDELAAATGLAEAALAVPLATLEASGGVLRVLGGRYGARRVIQRIHSRQRDRERTRHPAVSVQDLMRFLLTWQHVAPGSHRRGIEGLALVIDQLQGMEVAVGAWEEPVLAARVEHYRPQLLDELCASGAVAWGRLSLRNEDDAPRRASATPSRATPVALVRRDDLHWLLAAARACGAPQPPVAGASAEVTEALGRRGALFFSDLCEATGRLPLEVADALWDAVARGLVTADGFSAVRHLLAGRYRTATRSEHAPRRALRRPGRSALPPALAGGRWSLLEGERDGEAPDTESLAEAVACQLLERWGVVFRDLVRRESFALPWREVLFALRRLEARGLCRGGRFVAGPVGEQFALPEALAALRATARRPLEGSVIELSAADPLNLTGLLLPGERVPALRGRSLTLVDGLPRAVGAERALAAAAVG